MPAALPLLPSDPHQEFSATLEDRQYLFTVRWIARNASWYLSIFTEDGDAIRIGIRLVLGTALGRRSPDPRMPPGGLMVRDLADPDGTRGRDATLDDLGTRVQVWYYTREELAEG
jgi:hypothetical protein